MSGGIQLTPPLKRAIIKAGIKASNINPAPALRFHSETIEPNMPIGIATKPNIKGANILISFGRAVIAVKKGINREAIIPNATLIIEPLVINFLKRLGAIMHCFGRLAVL